MRSPFALASEIPQRLREPNRPLGCLNPGKGRKLRRVRGSFGASYDLSRSTDSAHGVMDGMGRFRSGHTAIRNSGNSLLVRTRLVLSWEICWRAHRSESGTLRTRRFRRLRLALRPLHALRARGETASQPARVSNPPPKRTGRWVFSFHPLPSDSGGIQMRSREDESGIAARKCEPRL